MPFSFLLWVRLSTSSYASEPFKLPFCDLQNLFLYYSSSMLWVVAKTLNSVVIYGKGMVLHVGTHCNLYWLIHPVFIECPLCANSVAALQSLSIMHTINTEQGRSLPSQSLQLNGQPMKGVLLVIWHEPNETKGIFHLKTELKQINQIQINTNCFPNVRQHATQLTYYRPWYILGQWQSKKSDKRI